MPYAVSAEGCDYYIHQVENRMRLNGSVSVEKTANSFSTNVIEFAKKYLAWGVSRASKTTLIQPKRWLSSAKKCSHYIYLYIYIYIYMSIVELKRTFSQKQMMTPYQIYLISNYIYIYLSNSIINKVIEFVFICTHTYICIPALTSGIYIYIYIYIYNIYIMSCRQHGYLWPSLATSSYRSSRLAGLHGYIPYPHRAVVCMFELAVLLFARQYEYIIYELVPASPAVSCMSGSSNLDSFRDGR